jgi:hypothetical protein
MIRRAISPLTGCSADTSNLIVTDNGQTQAAGHLFGSRLKLWLGKRNFNTGHAVI